jgi:hypothetical protein
VKFWFGYEQAPSWNTVPAAAPVVNELMFAPHGTETLPLQPLPAQWASKIWVVEPGALSVLVEIVAKKPTTRSPSQSS